MSVEDRISALAWDRIGADLDAQGWAVTGEILTATDRQALTSSYERDELFRSKVVMARHGFGRGEYKYFNDPHPALVAGLRRSLYEHLLATANRWRLALGQPPLSSSHSEFLQLCQSSGQTRPTPLLLRYRPGDYNCLHQDLYGEHVFPLQAAHPAGRAG